LAIDVMKIEIYSIDIDRKIFKWNSGIQNLTILNWNNATQQRKSNW